MAQPFSPKILMAGAALFAISVAGGYWISLQARPQGAVTKANGQPAKDELAGLFCPRMADEQAYKDNRVQTYATLIPGKDGWIFRTKNDFRTDWKANDSTLDEMAALQKAMHAHNAELVIVIPPVRGMVHTDEMYDSDKTKYKMNDVQAAWDNYGEFINEARDNGITMVGIDRDEVNDKFFYKRNHHWTADGARATAMKAASIIKTMPVYAQIEKTEYMTQPAKPQAYKSSYDRAFEKICGTNLPTENSQDYVTTPKDAASSQQALFDDQAAPQVILLGTSNSVDDSSQANFDGFLKEYLSADVMNLAVAGAGIDTSLISFLNSSRYKDNQPKIVIWEIPGYYNLDTMNDTVFSQAIPAAYGNCGDDALAHGDYKNVTDDAAIYASLDGGSDFGGPIPEGDSPIQPTFTTNNDLYLHLNFAQPVKQEFSVKFHYKAGDNGVTKILKFKRSNRYPADGEFYAMFPEMEKNAELNKIRITLPEKMKSTNMSMQVCSLPSAAAPDNESM